MSIVYFFINIFLITSIYLGRGREMIGLLAGLATIHFLDVVCWGVRDFRGWKRYYKNGIHLVHDSDKKE